VATAVSGGTAAEGKGEAQQKEAEDGDDGTPKLAVNPAGAGEEKKGGSDLVTAAAPNVACGGFEER
jgi:hypothetical protein